MKREREIAPLVALIIEQNPEPTEQSRQLVLHYARRTRDQEMWERAARSLRGLATGEAWDAPISDESIRDYLSS